MELNLKRPLIVFDLETTGLLVGKDRIIQIGMIKVMPDGTETTYTKLINPCMHIPEEVAELTGISDSDVASSPVFREVAQEIKDFIGDADLAGYNSNKFDIPMLVEEFLYNGIDFNISEHKMIDVQNIFHKMERRNLAAAYKFYCHKKRDDQAHLADNDARVTLDVLKAQLDYYDGYKDDDGNIPVVNDVDALARFSKIGTWVDLVGHIYYNDQCVPCFNFGKYKGKEVEQVFRKEPSYYSWMMNADFPLSTKKVIKQIKELM